MNRVNFRKVLSKIREIDKRCEKMSKLGISIDNFSFLHQELVEMLGSHLFSEDGWNCIMYYMYILPLEADKSSFIIEDLDEFPIKDYKGELRLRSDDDLYDLLKELNFIT